MRISRNKNDLHHGLYSKQIFDEFNEWLKNILNILMSNNIIL